LADPIFSAVILASQPAVHLEAALRSVSGQDYGAMEIVAVQRSSGDAAALLRRLLDAPEVRARVGRIVIVEAGETCDRRTAIDAGVRESRGDFISVVGPDDLLATPRVSRLLQACAGRRAELAFSRVQPLADGQQASNEEVEHVYAVQDDIEVFPTVGFALLRQDCVLATGNLVFSRRLYERLGGFRASEVSEAWDFALRSATTAEPAFVPEPLFTYRLHGRARFVEQQGMRASERDAVVRRYVFLCRNRPVDNPIAPSPAWGSLFESFLQTSLDY
jgi:hypothetical protein